MSIRLRLGPADIVSARFAISPLWEVGNAVRLLTRPEMSGYHAPWLASVQPELDSVDLSAVMALHPPGAGWVPDFMTPPPRRVSPTVEQQLAEVARTPLHFVTSELERTRPGQTDLAARAVIDELLADPAAGLARICAQLAEAWRVLVAPSVAADPRAGRRRPRPPRADHGRPRLRRRGRRPARPRPLDGRRDRRRRIPRGWSTPSRAPG